MGVTHFLVKFYVPWTLVYQVRDLLLSVINKLSTEIFILVVWMNGSTGIVSDILMFYLVSYMYRRVLHVSYRVRRVNNV